MTHNLHIHSECIIAFANGEKSFEFYSVMESKWFDCVYPPMFHANTQYRIKPKVEAEYWAYVPIDNGWCKVTEDDYDSYAIVVKVEGKQEGSLFKPNNARILSNRSLENKL